MKLVRSAWCLVLSAWCLGVSNEQVPAPPPRNSQVQVARRFWLAVLVPDDRAAYALLAPATRRALPLAAFRRTAAALRRQRPDRALELYKLGFRLEANGLARPFVAFGYAADSARNPRPAWLEATFADTAARAVWWFERRVR